MKKTICLLLLFACFQTLHGQETPQLETYTLKNGLKIYMIKYGKIEAMHLRVSVNCGKKNEVPGQQGYTSFIADMLLKGNAKYTEDAQNDKAFSIGGELQVGAGYDRTSISGNFLSKHAETAFDLISAAIRSPKFDKEKLDQLISYQTSYNNPTKMDIAVQASLYSSCVVHGTDNPLGRTYNKIQLKKITPQVLKEFHDFNFTPKNTAILLCGNFDLQQMKTLVEKFFGDWQSVYGEVNGVALEAPSIKKREYFFVNRMGANQCALRWNKTGPSIKDKDYLAFTISNLIFSEVLFREIREKGGKTYSINSMLRPSKYSNILSIACSVRSEEMNNTLALFDKTLKDFWNGSFTKEDFDIAVTRFKTDLYSNEMPEELANLYNPIDFDFKSRLALGTEVAKLSMEDVKKVVKKYYTPEIYKLVIAGDETRINDQLQTIKGIRKLSAVDLDNFVVE
jgi:zinc protease